MTRRTRPHARPVTPRQPASPRQPPRPMTNHADNAGPALKPGFAAVLWQAPILRQRNPELPLSLHEAIQLGREPDPEPAIQDMEAEP